MIWVVGFCALLAVVSFICGFLLAVVCYPSKGEIIERIKRDSA